MFMLPMAAFIATVEQVRADYAANDIERKWGDRRSAPSDYIFDRPVFLGKMRMGQDLANIGARAPAPEESPSPAAVASPAAAPGARRRLRRLHKQLRHQSQQFAGNSARGSPATSPAPAKQGAAVSSPPPSTSSSPAATVPAGQRTGVASPSPGQMANATPGGSSPVAPSAQTPGAPWPIQTEGLPPMYSAAWHHIHLYSPRSINLDSNMPSYRFLYEKRRISGERSADALQLSGSDVPPEGWEVVPSYDAKCLVAYLMALNQSHPLKGLRSTGGASAPGPSPAAAAQGASPAPSPAAAKK